MFQFTHPRGVRHRPHRRRPLRQAVSIHAPARGATAGQLSLACLAAFQFTHPRGVRHLRGDPLGHAPRVSIHAPARGATDVPRYERAMLKVSIHAPARGATGRPPGRAYLCSVSIHAPARGATCPRGIIYPLRPRFNSRTREGCDRAGTEETEEYRQFQFTHPRGVRPLLSLSSLSLSLVSIHAPARGATFAQPRRPLQPHVSIHAPARGATSIQANAKRGSYVSIHAPARGATGAWRA